MGLGLGISVDWASLVPYYAKVASAFAARVKADGGTVENTACLKKDLKALNPIERTGYLLTDYPGAAAAYSLRLINKTYAGSAIRVRRGPDNAEQNIGFASKQLDTEALESFVNSGEAFTDPDITSSSAWTKGSKTTYNAATEALDLLNENGLTARQGISVSGHTYTVTIVLDSVTSGGIKIYAGGTQSAVISTAGTHTLEITASNSNNFLGVNPSPAATCSISRFSAIDTTADAFVTTWYDQSGSGNDATQSAASAQPKIVSAGSTILENGKASVEWNGGTESLQSTFGTTYSQPNTIFVTANKTNHNGYLFDSLSGSKRHAQGNSDWIFAGAVLGGAYPFSSLGSQVLFTTNLNATSTSSYINSTLTKVGNAGTMGIDSLSLGRIWQLTSAALTGNIQEFILYPTDKLSNRSGIETNINDFYSIY